MCGKTNNTSTVSTEIDPDVKRAYNSLINLGTSVAQLPLQQYSGPMVAGFTPDQTAAFGLVQQAQGMALPYVNQASTWLGNSARDIFPTLPQYSQENLAPFMNPWQQSVIDSTMENMRHQDQVQQNDLLGRSIMSGSSPFFGDRAGVAAAELARGQGANRNQTLANLAASGFSNAQNAFQNQQQLQAGVMGSDMARQQAAAGQMAGLGDLAQRLTLQGAQALMGTGTMQQELGQQQLNVPYMQFQEQQKYPYNQANFLANLILGTGQQYGQTQTTTSPGPSPLSQIAGLGVGLAGLFGLNRGGRVPHRDTGGGVPQLDVTEFSMPQLNVSDWQVPQVPYWTPPPTTPGFSTGAQTYINALPQIPTSAMPAPRTYQLPSGVLSALRAFPRLDTGSGNNDDDDDDDDDRRSDRRAAGGATLGDGWLSSRLNNPLVYAGLAMMGGESPHPFVNIGQGALAGMQMHAQNNPELDEKTQLITDGPTYQIWHPSTGEIEDTGIPNPGYEGDKEWEPRVVGDHIVGKNAEGEFESLWQEPESTTPQYSRFKDDEGNLWQVDGEGKYDLLKSAPELTAIERQLEAGGLEPGTPEFQKKLLESIGPAQTTIEMPAGQTKWAEKEAEELLTRSLGIFDAAKDANATLDSYVQLEGLLTDPNVYTGFGGDFINSLKSMGSTLLGMDFEGVAEADVAKKIGAQIVGQIRKDVLSGSTSNADRIFLQQIPPNLGDSPEGIKLAVEMQRQATAGANAKAAKLQEIMARPENAGGLTMPGWIEFNNWVEQNPVFTPELMGALRTQAKASAVPRTPFAGTGNLYQGVVERFPWLNN